MITMPINDWIAYKALVSKKGLYLQYTESPTTYDIHAPEAGSFDWRISLLKGSSEATDFENNYQINANSPLSLHTDDGRPVITVTRFSSAHDPYMTGVGDANGVKRAGPRFEFSAVTTPQTIEFGFSDYVRVASGGLLWQGGVLGDRISLKLVAKAAPLVANPGAGNCNVVNGVVVPAAGDGDYDVDLATTSVVPSSDMTGYWNYFSTDTGIGTVTPGVPGSSGYHILSVDQDLVYWVADFPILGSGSQYIDPNSIDRKIYPRWTWVASVVSATQHGGLSCAFFLNLARTSTI